MSNLSAPFPTLVETLTGEAVALSKIQSGDPVAGKNGSLSFGFQNQAGEAVLPTVNAQGQVPVSLAATSTPVGPVSNDVVVSGNLDVSTLVRTFDIVAGETYSVTRFGGHCSFDGIFKLVQVNDATEVVLGTFETGVAQKNSGKDGAECPMFTAGATGTQKVELRHTRCSGPTAGTDIFVGGSFCLNQLA